jgi:hypothetical protein
VVFGFVDHVLDNLPPYRSTLVASADLRGGRTFAKPNSTRVQLLRLLTEENDWLRRTLWPERIPAKRGNPPGSAGSEPASKVS